MANEKVLIIKGDNGIGNRLLSLAKGLAYAQISGRRVVVDWRDGMYADKGVDSFQELFVNPLVDPGALVSVTTKSIFPKNWVGNLEKSIYEMVYGDHGFFRFVISKIVNLKSKYVIDLSKSDYKEDVLVMSDVEFNFRQIKNNLSLLPVEWPREEKSLLKYIFKKYIILKQDIVDAVTNFRKDYFKGNVIGVHIRYTDNFNFIIEKTKLEEYFYIIDNILKDKPNSTIFLATDSKNVLDEFKKRYSNVVSTDKPYPSTPGTPMHYYVGYKNKLDMARSALVDMYLLSCGNYLVSTKGSSFSYISGVISDIEDNKKFIVGTSQTRAHIFLYQIKDFYSHFLGVAGKNIKKYFPKLYRVTKSYFPDIK